MTEIQDLAVRVGDRLVEREMTISVGEIDTGGLIGSRLMAVPGATRFFKGGIICYGGTLMREVVKISPDLLQEKGAVSPEVATALAHQVRELSDADITIAQSGITGPTGSRSGRPIGMVYIALVGRDNTEIVIQENWDSPDRYGNMLKTTERALRLVWEHLTGHI